MNNKLTEDTNDLLEAWDYLLEVDLIDKFQYAEKIKELCPRNERVAEMKHIKLFEEFLNENESQEEGLKKKLAVQPEILL